MGHPTRRLSSSLLLVLLSCLPAVTALAQQLPRFEVDASWPRQLPNNWILGQIGGIAVDSHDHIWVYQRPNTLTDDERAATIHIVEQAAVVFAHISPRVIGANADDNCAVAAEIARGKFLRRDDAGIQADALQDGRNFIPGTHDVADFELWRQLYVHGLNFFS